MAGLRFVFGGGALVRGVGGFFWAFETGHRCNVLALRRSDTGVGDDNVEEAKMSTRKMKRLALQRV